MNNERRNKYAEILNSVKNSPIEMVEFEGNFYHFKLDYTLPYGECHYARVFSQLLYLKESLGIINQGDILLETTSGSGGRAAAAVATALGYNIKIAIPAGGEKAREESIVKAGGEVILTPADLYVNGFPLFIRDYLRGHRGTKYINHAMGDIFGRGVGVNQIAVDAFSSFVYEVLESGICPDIVISPLGNGTTTLPMVTRFKSLLPNTKVWGFESILSGNAYRKYYHNRYEEVFGVNPDIFTRHDLPGSSPARTDFPMPALEAAIPLLGGVALVTSDHADNQFAKATGYQPSDKGQVVKWDDLSHEAITDFGRTGRAGFAVAVDLARAEKMSGKHFLVPVFDAAWHYDS